MNYRKRRANLYQPHGSQAFGISRSKIDLFLTCPRCFYIDRRLGLGRPSMPGFSLNAAVDHLLKKEFDLLRLKGEAHTLMKEYSIDAIPYQHPDIPVWRDDFNQYVGVSVLHRPTNFLISGIIDDVWINKNKELIVVDYKSTSTSKVISLEDEFKQGYKKQMEVYQWIFRQKGFAVQDTGYFVFANAGKNREKFDGQLVFDLSIVPYTGNDSWVEPTLLDIHRCLSSDHLPSASESCEYCSYRKEIMMAMEPFRKALHS